ncbi:MAG: rhodanese-like domain-containing protein [Terrimicrobiaceae bacterium]
MQHANKFLALVDECLVRIKEVSVEEASVATRGGPAVLVDVREDREWVAGHAVGAVHIGKGVIERDIERLYPDPETPLYCYCGGGYRSALVAEALQKMGYTKVYSVAGGIKAWAEAGLPLEN